MTTFPIEESGLQFGPFPDGYCYHIEKSDTYRNIQDGVKMAEFLWLRTAVDQPPTVWIVEAKRSSPRPGTLPAFDTFIAEIHDKLHNALLLGVAACLRRHSTATELPTPFMTLDLASTGFRLVLGINGHRDRWLIPIHRALNKALTATRKVWALSPTSIMVINEHEADKLGLILRNATEAT